MTPSPESRVVAIDFFCGCGGLTRGLLDAGIQVLAGVDIDARLRQTYEHNNKPSRFVHADAREINIHDLRSEVGIREHDVVVYAACTPCQPFSTLNQMRGKDDRKELIIAFAELVQAAPPDYIIVENVPGLNQAYGREIYERFISMIEAAGFEHRYAERLDAYDFGVPQVRKRFIMLASRHRPIKPPRRATRKAVVRTYLGRLPAVREDDKKSRLPNHVARKLSAAHKRIVAAVPKNGGSRCDIEDTSILLRCHQENPNVHKDVFGRMVWEGPAPTLTQRCTDVYCGRFIHPFEDRGLSLREAAALQTFANNYEFFGTFFHIAGQIGNAVPVKLAKRLGAAVLRTVKEGES